jgi:hypothetical protein
MQLSFQFLKAFRGQTMAAERAAGRRYASDFFLSVFVVGDDNALVLSGPLAGEAPSLDRANGQQNCPNCAPCQKWIEDTSGTPALFRRNRARRRGIAKAPKNAATCRNRIEGVAMDFASDNGAGVAPEILEAIAASSRVNAPAYGADDYTARAAASLSEVFETKVEAFLVATGTAANALALSALTRPWEAVFCHEEAHVHDDECGAAEFFTGGRSSPASRARAAS